MAAAILAPRLGALAGKSRDDTICGVGVGGPRRGTATATMPTRLLALGRTLIKKVLVMFKSLKEGKSKTLAERKGRLCRRHPLSSVRARQVAGPEVAASVRAGGGARCFCP